MHWKLGKSALYRVEVYENDPLRTHVSRGRGVWEEARRAIVELVCDRCRMGIGGDAVMDEVGECFSIRCESEIFYPTSVHTGDQMDRRQVRTDAQPAPAC